MKPSSRSSLQREADQRHLNHDEVAEQVGEARARGLGRRLHLDPAVALAELEVVEGLEVELGRLADLAQHDRVLLGQPVGGARGRAGSGARRASSSWRSSISASSGSSSFSSAFSAEDLAQLATRGRRPRPERVASSIWSETLVLLGAALVDPGAQLAAALVERQQLVELHPPRRAAPAPRGRGRDRGGSASGRAWLGSGCARGRLWAWVDVAASSTSVPEYSATKRATFSASSPTTMFWGMIAPEKPPFADRVDRVLVASPCADRGSGPGCAGCGWRCPAAPAALSVWHPEQRSAKSSAPSWTSGSLAWHVDALRAAPAVSAAAATTQVRSVEAPRTRRDHIRDAHARR